MNQLLANQILRETDRMVGARFRFGSCEDDMTDCLHMLSAILHGAGCLKSLYRVDVSGSSLSQFLSIPGEFERRLEEGFEEALKDGFTVEVIEVDRPLYLLAFPADIVTFQTYKDRDWATHAVLVLSSTSKLTRTVHAANKDGNGRVVKTNVPDHWTPHKIYRLHG